MSNRMKLFLLTASLAGALFSLANAGGAHLLCRTEGCRIYAGYGLFGISFYVFGAAGFLAIFVLALLHPRRTTGALLYLALLAALALDTLFLAYQALFWPCSSCLAVALLLGLIGLAGIVLFTSGRKLLLAVGSIWLVFFLFVGLSTAREIGSAPGRCSVLRMLQCRFSSPPTARPAGRPSGSFSITENRRADGILSDCQK